MPQVIGLFPESPFLTAIKLNENSNRLLSPVIRDPLRLKPLHFSFPKTVSTNGYISVRYPSDLFKSSDCISSVVSLQYLWCGMCPLFPRGSGSVNHPLAALLCSHLGARGAQVSMGTECDETSLALEAGPSCSPRTDIGMSRRSSAIWWFAEAAVYGCTGGLC